MVDVERAIAELLARDDAVVPAGRAIAHRIAALLEGRDLAVDELAHIASADPGIAAEVLSAAGALSGGEAPASLPLAIARIGDLELLRIAREAARGAARTARGPLDAQLRQAERSAVACALLCRELARARRLDADAAWLCGLLHDVGRLTALSAIERLAAGARLPWAAGGRWEGLVERWHVSLGVSAAERLGLPRVVLDAIAFHHAERLDPGRSPELVRLVRTAGAIVRAAWDEPPAAGDEAAIADLSDGEAEHLAPVVAALPSALSPLECRAGPGAPRAAGAGEAPALHESKGDGVRLYVAGREYAAVGFAPYQLLVSGPAPLGEGALLEVELIERRGLAFHARVLLAWGEGERFGAILMPLALAGPATLDWRGRVPVGATA